MLNALRRRSITFNSLKQNKRTLANKSDNDLPEKSTPTELTNKKYDPKDVTKEDLRWRTPWHQREAPYYSALRTFYSEDNNRSVLQLVQTNIDLSPTAIKNWWNNAVKEKDISTQAYVPARHQTLGSELAASHFIVHRGGSIKFYDDDKWIKANKRNEYTLPRFYQDDKILQAIDCTDMDLYYEGLFNLHDLKQVEWLSLNGCEHMDDWCIDKISNIFSHSLIYLDLRNCPKITDKGIGALYKMRNLKILYLDDFLMSTTYEMTCLLLQEANPSLDIRSEEY